MGHKFARFVVFVLLHLVSHMEVQGYERVPTSGSFIVASNHLGRLDVPLVYYFLNRKDIIMMVAEKYYENRILRWFFNLLDVIWVDRYHADLGAMRAALKRLRQGQVLTIAPEGTRSKTEALLPGRPGVSYLAAKAQVPIIPVAVTGTEDAHVKACLRRLRRTHILIRVGMPFTLPPLKGGDREAALAEYTDEIMCRIGALLPPNYRGVYADHPRLKELLATSQAAA
jgi:1-acyl-sn-glycerol-3-phosphate acyltransferase